MSNYRDTSTSHPQAPFIAELERIAIDSGQRVDMSSAPMEAWMRIRATQSMLDEINSLREAAEARAEELAARMRGCVLEMIAGIDGGDVVANRLKNIGDTVALLVDWNMYTIDFLDRRIVEEVFAKHNQRTPR